MALSSAATRSFSISPTTSFVFFQAEYGIRAIGVTGVQTCALPISKDKRPTKTAVVLAFGPRGAGPPDAAPWTSGAPWLPPDDAAAEVRYRDPTQMGKVYLLPAGVARKSVV